MKAGRRRGFPATSDSVPPSSPGRRRGKAPVEAVLPPECQEALGRLRAGIIAGRPWVEVLLEAIGLWTAPQEVRHGKLSRYLIAEEAFDLFHLAERLCEEVDGLIPLAEREELFRGRQFPPGLSEQRVKSLVGSVKYRSYLNYWYGVTVEQGLQAAVRGEIRKERLSRGVVSRARIASQALARIYGEPHALLVEQFLAWEGSGDQGAKGSFEAREFTYWLFKQRLQRSEKARVASDTRKALLWLQRHRFHQVSHSLLEEALTEDETEGVPLFG